MCTAPLGLRGLATGSAASLLKQKGKVRTAPLGLLGLAPGSGASGEMLRRQPPEKMLECALRPWGCVAWPGAPLRAT